MSIMLLTVFGSVLSSEAIENVLEKGNTHFASDTTVLILVNSEIYYGIAEHLNVFMSDLQSEGIQVQLDFTTSETSPIEIRAQIKYYYDNYALMGAILIGEIRAAYTEVHTGSFSNPQAIEVKISVDANDLYYMDLDGQWEHVIEPDFCDDPDKPQEVVECSEYDSCDYFWDEYIVALDEALEWDFSMIENKEQFHAEIWISRIMAHNLEIPAFSRDVSMRDRAYLNVVPSNDSSLNSLTYAEPDLTLYEPDIEGMTATMSGVVYPGDSGATITSIEWNWGDGTELEHQWFPASHSYAAYGQYTITATAHQSDGLTASEAVQADITSGLEPVIILSAPEVEGLAAAVNGFVHPGDSSTTITSIVWDWGDGTEPGQQWFPASHLYEEYGLYAIMATAHQSDGLTGTETVHIVLTIMKTEIEIINEYLEWNHRYRSGEYSPSDNVYHCDAINNPVLDPK